MLQVLLAPTGPTGATGATGPEILFGQAYTPDFTSPADGISEIELVQAPEDLVQNGTIYAIRDAAGSQNNQLEIQEPGSYMIEFAANYSFTSVTDNTVTSYALVIETLTTLPPAQPLINVNAPLNNADLSGYLVQNRVTTHFILQVPEGETPYNVQFTISQFPTAAMQQGTFEFNNILLTVERIGDPVPNP